MTGPHTSNQIDTDGIADGAVTAAKTTGVLLANGNVDLEGNLAVDASVTIDGVDISAHDHSGAGQGGTVQHADLGGTTSGDHHTKTQLDDTPVDNETDKGITSNWAYDHENGSDPHSAAGYIQECDRSPSGSITAVSSSADTGSQDSFSRGDHQHSCVRYSYPRIWYQSSQPGGADNGDIWIDSDNGDLWWKWGGNWEGPALT